jgi:hypothetical protein
MVKTLLLTTIIGTNLTAQTALFSTLLQKNCLNCHTQQQIPNELIYRRYLVKYSTHKAIKQTLLDYLKNPKKENSIMPTPFFLKFSQKKAMDLNETELNKNIDEFLDYFDIRKKLVLP